MADISGTIDSALTDAVTGYVKELILNYTDAAGDATKEAEADEGFRRGLAIARRAADRARTLVNE